MQGQVRRPRSLRFGNEVIIPAGSEGCFFAEYKVPGEPTLTLSHWNYLVRFPRSCFIRTSSGRKGGYGVERYYFEWPNGNRREIPENFGSCSSTDVCILTTEYTGVRDR